VQIEVAFTEDDRRLLERALGQRNDLDAIAELIARAGAAESLALATGRAVPSTMADVRAMRIYGLVQQGVDLTDVEALVAVLFKVPTATAKRMVSSSIARYAVELTESLTAAIGTVLDAASWNEENGRWEVRMASAFLRERILAAADPLPVPDPTRSGGSIWRFADETYQAVRESFNLPARPAAP
jgi:hypothetical protein